MPKIIKPAKGTFTTADITIDEFWKSYSSC